MARWYDPVLAHFIQADTLLPEPGFAISYDRYAYVNNSPINYSDPSGHAGWGPEGQSGNWSLGVTTNVTISKTNEVTQVTFTTTDSKFGTLIDKSTYKVDNTINVSSLINNYNYVELPNIMTDYQQVTIGAAPVDTFTIGAGQETILTDRCVVPDTDWVTVTIDLVGIAGDGALAFGPPGWLAWGGSEIIEGVGLGWALLKPEPDYSAVYWWYIGKFFPGFGSIVDGVEIYIEITSCEIYESIPAQRLRE